MKGIVKGLIIGGVIAAIGGIIMLVIVGIKGCDISDREFTMSTFTATEDNTELNIDIGAGKLNTKFYDGDKVIIEYPVASGYNSSVTEKAGKVKFISKPKWYSFVGKWNVPDTVIKLPKDVNFVIKAEMGAGSITLANGNYKDVELDISAGTFKCGTISCDLFKCEISAGTATIGTVNCNRFICDMSAGTVSVDEVVSNNFECELSAGSVNLDKLTANKTDVDISAGSVKLRLTGEQAEYGISTHVSAGSCNVGSQSGSTDKRIEVHVSAGSVKLDFGV